MCTELTQCKYHPVSVLYPRVGSGWLGAGLYPCCQQTVLRFDPSGMSKVGPSTGESGPRAALLNVCLLVQGCRNRDHMVTVSEDDCDEGQVSVLNDLLLHRDAVCVSVTPPPGSASHYSSLCVCVCAHARACACVCVCSFIESAFEIFCSCVQCVCVCVSMNRAEGGPGVVELPDCEGLLEPTLLGPLRGDGSPVSLAFCLSGPHLSIVCLAEKCVCVCVHGHFHTSVCQSGHERTSSSNLRQVWSNCSLISGSHIIWTDYHKQSTNITE